MTLIRGKVLAVPDYFVMLLLQKTEILRESFHEFFDLRVDVLQIEKLNRYDDFLNSFEFLLALNLLILNVHLESLHTQC